MRPLIVSVDEWLDQSPLKKVRSGINTGTACCVSDGSTVLALKCSFALILEGSVHFSFLFIFHLFSICLFILRSLVYFLLSFYIAAVNFLPIFMIIMAYTHTYSCVCV